MFVLFSYLQIFLTNIVIFLLLTLIIAIITLMERKILSLVQRRVGPNYIGYRDRLQFIALYTVQLLLWFLCLQLLRLLIEPLL